MTTAEILTDAAETFIDKQRVYGDNHDRLSGVLAAMFPKGVVLNSPRDHERFSLLNLIVVKLTRYAVQWEKGHQDSIRDIIVYAAMLEERDADRNQSTQRKSERSVSPTPKFNLSGPVDEVVGKGNSDGEGQALPRLRT